MIDNSITEEIPAISHDDVIDLFPQWTLIKKRDLSFDDKEYTVLFLQHKKVKEKAEGKMKLAVIQYDQQRKKWINVWESTELGTFLIFDNEHNVGEFTMTEPEQSKALLAFHFNGE